MGFIDLAIELERLIRQWDQDGPDWPATEMVAFLDLQGVSSHPGMDPWTLANNLAGLASAMGKTQEMLDSLAEMRAEAEEGDEIILEDFLATHLQY